METRNRKSDWSGVQKVGLMLGPVLFLTVVLVFDLKPGKPVVTRMAAVTIWMAAWWITDAIPLFATALLPLILFPLLGILEADITAPLYVNSTIFLFLGGFMIAMTMEKWNLHRRIALFVIRVIGGGPSRIVLGFMAAAGFLSMWISNTATAIMMVPIGMAIILQMEERFSEGETHNFSVSLMLGIAYACSVGGMATLVGTPPNLALARIFAITFPHAPAISFAQWMIMGVPVALVMLVVIWLVLTRLFFRVPPRVTVDKSIVEREYRKLGFMGFEEKAILIVFLLTAVLWIFSKDLNLGSVAIPGWSSLLPYPDMIDDGTVAIFMALTLFLIPTRGPDAESATISDATLLKNLPWNIVLLFGGGFALAKGFQSSGLSAVLGEKFGMLTGMPTLVMIGLVCFGLTFLTEVTSNTATTQMILPVLASMAVDARVNPLLLMIPAALSASCAFMMPVGTPPNAIVFGSGRVRIAEMARVGVAINLIGVAVIALSFYFLGTAVFGIDLQGFPEWAHVTPIVKP